MKVLYFNWVDYLDPEKRGGGVTIYQRNLIEEAESHPSVDAWFLSSGISYDVLPRPARWEQVRHGPEQNRERRFEIVNSGVLSPSHFSFGNPNQVSHVETVDAFADFVETNGPFDVIHFQSLEGLPAEVLDLKQRWPDTVFVVSVHNYYYVCPQVNLWYQEAAHCDDFDGGRKCQICLMGKPDERSVRLAGSVAFRLKKNGISPGTRLFDRGFSPLLRVARKTIRTWAQLTKRRDPFDAANSGDTPLEPARNSLQQLEAPTGRPFAERRAAMIEAINRNCDLVLCVSDRVRSIMERYGIQGDRLRTLYIGTQQASVFDSSIARPAIPATKGELKLAYLGYMRADKGFFFLLNALEALPDDLARHIHLVVAAPKGGGRSLKRLSALSERLGSVRYSDGYTHDQLDTILADVDVGLVPVLWEDNLPQVAIEMHARRIPLLTSDRGGARELGNCPDMVFPVGDIAKFAERLRWLLEGRLDTEAYWAGARRPMQMDDHVTTLLRLYRERHDANGQPAIRAARG